MLETRNYIMMALGAFGAVLLVNYVPSTMKVMSSSNYSPDYANNPGVKERFSEQLEDIPGIDTYSLVINRQKGY